LLSETGMGIALCWNASEGRGEGAVRNGSGILGVVLKLII